MSQRAAARDEGAFYCDRCDGAGRRQVKGRYDHRLLQAGPGPELSLVQGPVSWSRRCARRLWTSTTPSKVYVPDRHAGLDHGAQKVLYPVA